MDYRKKGEPYTRNDMVGLEYEGKYISATVIMDAIELAVRKALSNHINGKIRGLVVDDILEKGEENGVIPLENEFFYKLPDVNPMDVLRGRNIVGVDGGAFSLRLHPLRIVIAKTAVYALSMNSDRSFDIKDVWKFSVSILRKNGNVVEQVRRKIKEVLVSLEASTIRELAEEYSNIIDIVIWDGPLYTRKFFNKFYTAIKSLVDRAIICIKIVKNPFSSWLSKTINLESLSDADMLSYYLFPNMRTAMFLFDGKIVANIPYDMKPVFFYVKTGQRVIVRYEFPYGLIEEYGKEEILRIISADLQLGSGISYVVSRADKIARFCDEEKRHIAYRIFIAFKKCGVTDLLMYNQLRWGRFLYRWGQG